MHGTDDFLGLRRQTRVVMSKDNRLSHPMALILMGDWCGEMH